MLLLTIVLFGIPFAVSLLLSRHSALGPVRKSPLNPLLVYALFVVLIAADFGSMALTGSGHLASNTLITTPSDLLFLQIRFVSMLTAALAGVGAGFSFFRAMRKPNQPLWTPAANVRVVSLALYLALLGAWYLTLRNMGFGISSLADAAQIKVQAKTAPLFILSLALLPGLSYALPRWPLRVVLPVVAVSLGLLFFSGSRSRLLYVLIPFAFYLVRVRGMRVPRSFFVIGVVALGFLAIVAVNFREAVNHRKIVTVEALVDTSGVLNSNDVSYAETNLALSRINRKAIEGYPGQDLVGLALAGIPRALVPFKPDTGSRQFTLVYDKFTIAQFNRGLTIGALNEVEYDYPFPAALIVIFLLLAGWGFAFAKAINSRSLHGFAWSIGLYVAFYLLQRGDLQASGQVLWMFLLYTPVILLVQKITALVAPQARGYRRRAPTRPITRPQLEPARITRRLSPRSSSGVSSGTLPRLAE